MNLIERWVKDNDCVFKIEALIKGNWAKLVIFTHFTEFLYIIPFHPYLIRVERCYTQYNISCSQGVYEYVGHILNSLYNEIKQNVQSQIYTQLNPYGVKKSIEWSRKVLDELYKHERELCYANTKTNKT